MGPTVSQLWMLLQWLLKALGPTRYNPSGQLASTGTESGRQLCSFNISLTLSGAYPYSLSIARAPPPKLQTIEAANPKISKLIFYSQKLPLKQRKHYYREIAHSICQDYIWLRSASKKSRPVSRIIRLSPNSLLILSRSSTGE